jgi:hypothetical protein
MGSEVYPDVDVTNVMVVILVPLLPFVNSPNFIDKYTENHIEEALSERAA